MISKGLSAYFGLKQGLYRSFRGQKGQYGKNSESCDALSDAKKCGTGRRVNGNMIYVFSLFSVLSHKNDHFYLTVKDGCLYSLTRCRF
ncbi:MAG: hypothetical protein DRI57_22665 [Deltaproteobacteria bacterium]|nr:MAG: hypothetical protein DRI57_22665 [Deltaproteobacteria bacterium]